ncbi:MAG: hypothetical protein JJE39_12835 [Vicinamibacteria bacterium]|nr:hypothetical protein [Vicinamibacteria bacterium]
MRRIAPPEVLEAAALASERVLQSKSLTQLEAVAPRLAQGPPARSYLVVDTSNVLPETLALACSISVWEARQWQAASRYRLFKVITESTDEPPESVFQENGLTLFALPEQAVVPGRSPILIESIDLSARPIQCTLRRDAEAPPERRELTDHDVALIVSAPIKRERVKDQTSLRVPADTRREEAFLVHIHLRGEVRPWEIDPLRTAYEGAQFASAHMSTRELVRRLSAKAPHDQAFRNIVPVLSPGADPSSDFAGLSPSAKKARKAPKIVVFDNVAQFREYSAWRGATERERLNRSQV